MNKRTIAPRSALAAFLVALFALLCLPSVGLAAGKPSSPVKLAPAVIERPMTSARAALLAAGAYVHVANCQWALTGANGDNDVQNSINSHSPYGISSWGWSGSIRHANDDVIVGIDFYNSNGYLGTAGGHCWGSDANITDRVEWW